MKIGQKVAVIDDSFSGIVVKIKGDIVTIRTSDDFELDFSQSEIVVMDGSLSNKNLFKTEFSVVLSEKEQSQAKKVNKPKVKGKQQPPMEVDLHSHQLISNSKHLHAYDILALQIDTAKRKLEFAMAKRIQRVVFIHGVGEGVLRSELEFLFRHYDNLKFYDADYQKYGMGATEVYIFQNVKQ